MEANGGTMINKVYIPINVLIVDDNEVNTMILANMLELFGIIPLQLHNGINAIEQAKMQVFDLVFIDHLMPIMDGVETTSALREQAINSQSIIIIGLTAQNNEEIKRLFLKAGANDIYEKPIGINEVDKILIQWCAELYSKSGVDNSQYNDFTHNKDDLLKKLMDEMEGIDYMLGLHYALGNPSHYFNILEASLKDIQTYREWMEKSLNHNVFFQELRIGLHNLRNVFLHIGATKLSDDVKKLEACINSSDLDEIMRRHHSFMNEVENFKKQLIVVMEKFRKLSESRVEEQNIVYPPMSTWEYEQCLSITIYYIKRFEYDAILRELEKLIQRGPKSNLKIFEEIIQYMKDFNYEKALYLVLKLKNEIGKEPISIEHTTINL